MVLVGVEVSPGADSLLLSDPAPTAPVLSVVCRAATVAVQGQKPQSVQGLPELLLKKREVLCAALSLAVFLKNLRGCEMEAVPSLTWGNSTERERKKPWRRISSFLSPVPPCLFS